MNTEKNLYQWDTGQKLTGCIGLYVDFLIDNEVYRVETADGMCIIPDELLQTAGKHRVYECMTDNTIRASVFDVTERPKPPDYVYTPTEKLTFDGLVQRVDDAVADMIRRADSGEFDGYTPVKGVDYFTTEEVQQIQNEVSEGAIGEFKSVVDTETNKFNTNATEKLNAYNSNAQAKLDLYNQNDSEKTEAYNSNAQTKLADYNTNADNRVAEFNSQTEQIQTDISELKSDIVNKIDAPENPTIGKILKIKSVNEDGTFNCEWADDESGAVEDVQINGTSIVADSVANIPIVNRTGEYGLVKFGETKKSSIYFDSNGNAFVGSASSTQLDNRTVYPIFPNMLDYAVKAAMCDGKGADWTAEEQAMARARMGAVYGLGRLIKTVNIEEETALVKMEVGDDGNPFKLRAYTILVLSPTGMSSCYPKCEVKFTDNTTQYLPNINVKNGAKVVQMNVDISRGYPSVMGNSWASGNANAESVTMGAPMTAWYPNPSSFKAITGISLTNLAIPSGSTVYLFGSEV